MNREAAELGFELMSAQYNVLGALEILEDAMQSNSDSVLRSEVERAIRKLKIIVHK